MNTFVDFLFKKRCFVYLFSWFCFGQLPAQEALPTVKTPQSPTAASLGIYGKIPVSKYTGIPDISIPLYTIDIGSLQIPVTLSYHPGGVRVEAEASWVGLGWSLMAGGMISREIKGLDDFYVGGHWYRYNITGNIPSEIKPIPSYPMDCYYENGDCRNYFDWETRFDLGKCYVPGGNGIAYPVYKRTLKTDCEPDLFTYNFLGYHGRFVLKEGENTAILEKPEDGLKISITESWNGVGILVVLPTGDKLYFYDYEENTPFSGAKYINDFAAIVGKTSISSWSLTGIETVDGNYVAFEYAVKNNVERNVYRSNTFKTKNYLNTPSLMARLTKTLTFSEIPNASCGGISSLPELSTGNSQTSVGSFGNQELYLKKIMWNGNKIDFLHAPRADYGYPYDNKDKPVYLDAMEIKNQKNKLIKRIVFGYSYFDTSNITYPTNSPLEKKRLRLDFVCESNPISTLPPYRFTYDTRFDLPFKTSLSFDAWGYFNGTAAYQPTDFYLFPEIVKNNRSQCYFNWEYPEIEGSVVMNGKNMRCNPTYVTTGMLQKITYPTGGCAEFTFESNRYINLNQQEKIGGGVRIARIKTDASERIFDYNDGGKASGFLLVEPVFGYNLEVSGSNCIVYSSRSLVQLQGNSCGSFVGYKKVTEKVICDGKTASTVDNYYSDSELQPMNLYTYDSHGMNGRLLSQYLYDGSNLVQKNGYDYTSTPISLRPNQRAMKYEDGIIHCYMVFPEQHKRLASKQQTHYIDGKSSQSVTTVYSYNDQNFLVNQISKTGDGKELLSKVTYTSDLNKDMFAELNNLNMIKPVETTQYIRANGVEKVTGSILNLYNEFAQPTKVYKLETGAPLSNFVPFTSTAGVNRDSRYSSIPELELSYFDGNIILPEEIIMRDGVHEFYIWGHSNSYILAKIENVTKDQVKQYIPGYANLYDDEPTDELYQKINNLRTQLPQSRVTTYIYDSLIGLKKCINPDGTSVYYEYDGLNRLKCIKDNSGNIIEQYDYKYKQ